MAPRIRRKRGRRPQQANGVVVREQIIASARTVFSDVGYTAATFYEIAARIDLARASLTYYFTSKSQLYSEAVAQPAGAVMDAAVATAHRACTLPSQLAAFLSTALDANSADRGGPDVLNTALYESLRRPAQAADMMATAREFFASAVEDAIGRGELRTEAHATDLADIMASIMLGVGVIATDSGKNTNLPAITDAFERLCANTLWRLNTPDQDASTDASPRDE